MQTSYSTESNEPREIAVRKYFTRTPSRPSYFLTVVFGVIASIGATTLLILFLQRLGSRSEPENGCSSCLWMLSLGTFIVCGSIAVVSYFIIRNRFLDAWRRAEPKPTDAQVDAWHAADLERLTARALEKLDLSPEQVAQDNPDGRPLVVEGPGPSPSVRAGADRVLRFSIHEILVVYLTKYHLASYKCTVSLVDGLLKSESTQEYHYNDVVSVSTQTDQSGFTWYEDGERRQIPSFQRFALSVASGEQISVAIRPDAAEMKSGHSMPESGADRAIRAIRTHLREKKGGTMDGGKGADPSVL